MKFLLASLKTLTNFKSCSETSIKYLFRLSFALILIASVHSQPAFGTIFRITRVSEQFLKAKGGYQKAGTSPMKWVTGRNFTISK